jgi:Zn-dependent protease
VGVRAVSLGRVGPIELRLHQGWLLTFAFTTSLMALVILPAFFSGWSNWEYWMVGVGVALAENLAGLLHELGHAWVAIAHGRKVHGITLYGFTAAARRSTGRALPLEQFLIAMAGPLSHFVLAGILWGTLHALPHDSAHLRVLVGFPVVTNLTVGVLNLVPLSPLDGARAFRAIVAAFAGSQ